MGELRPVLGCRINWKCLQDEKTSCVDIVSNFCTVGIAAYQEYGTEYTSFYFDIIRAFLAGFKPGLGE